LEVPDLGDGEGLRLNLFHASSPSWIISLYQATSIIFSLQKFMSSTSKNIIINISSTSVLKNGKDLSNNLGKMYRNCPKEALAYGKCIVSNSKILKLNTCKKEMMSLLGCIKGSKYKYT